eukprot:Em0019g1229a
MDFYNIPWRLGAAQFDAKVWRKEALSPAFCRCCVERSPPRKMDSFALDKYVEKLAQLDPTTGLGPLGNSKVKPFDATVLLRSFQTSMVVLKELAEKNERRVEKLEQVCSKQQKEHAVKLKDLEGIYADAKSEFQVLEDRITYVATKVVHLGDQLETLNSCMLRDLEAQDVMKHVAEFEQKAKPTVGVFTDPSRRLQAAELISKLNNLAVELPKTTKPWDGAYGHGMGIMGWGMSDMMPYESTSEIDTLKLKATGEGLHGAQNYLDVKRMKEYAQALQTFRRELNDVIEFYIDKNLPNPSASSVPSLDDIIAQVETQCDKANTQAKQVFESPDLIMGQFIDTVIHRVVERYIDKELSSLAMQLQTKLSCFVTDGSYLAKEFRTKLFGKYLSGYARHEIENLEDVCLQVTQSSMMQPVGQNTLAMSGRSLSGMVARIKTILTDNQKKTDYNQNDSLTNYTQPSNSVHSYLLRHVFVLQLTSLSAAMCSRLLLMGKSGSGAGRVRIISDNKQAHFHLGFDNEKRLTENMAEFSPRKPIDPSLPAAGKSNGLAAKHSVMALGNINPRDPVNMNLRRAFLEYDKDLSGSISKDELLSVCSAINIDVDDKEIQDLIMKLTPMQKLVWEQEAKRHVPLLPVVLHQVPHTTITRSDFIAPEEVVQSSN